MLQPRIAQKVPTATPHRSSSREMGPTALLTGSGIYTIGLASGLLHSSAPKLAMGSTELPRMRLPAKAPSANKPAATKPVKATKPVRERAYVTFLSGRELLSWSRGCGTERLLAAGRERASVTFLSGRGLLSWSRGCGRKGARGCERNNRM